MTTTATPTAKDAIKNLSTELEAVQATFTERAKELLKPALAEYFEARPKVESFSWNQYTPYFNDGEECTFGVNCDGESIDVNGVSYYDAENVQSHVYFRDEDGKHASRPNPDFDQELHDCYEAAGELISVIPSDILKSVFGDHIQVTAHRDGRIETDEYDHD